MRDFLEQPQGMWARYIKSAFERYFIWKIKSGNIVPFFEEEGLKLFFGTKGVILCADCSGAPGSAC
jgi:sulfide:quinone oxidoreductase